MPTNAIVSQVDNEIIGAGFQVTKIGLIFNNNPPDFDQWQQLGKLLSKLDERVQLVIGDWLAYGLDELLVTYQQVAEVFERDPHTIENYAWVCRAVPNSLRRESLFYGHYELVASERFSLKSKEIWLNAAVENNWSISQMREELNRQNPKGRPALPKPMRAQALKLTPYMTKIARIADRAGENKKVSDDDRRAVLSQINALRAWLDEAERIATGVSGHA